MQLLFILYDVAWYLALPWVYGLLLVKSLKLRAYREHLGERFGWSLPGGEVDVWIHAVSVGEAVAATTVIEACLQQQQRVLVTTMTPTGLAQVQRTWGDKVSHQFIPYDFSWAIHRFLNHRKPKIFLIFETELWPGIIRRCYQRHIPVLLLNARISDRSYGRYLKTKFFWAKLFSYFTSIFCQSELDKQKFLSLGAQSTQLHVAGNLKFNQKIQAHKVKAWQTFKACYPNCRVIVFGSTHPGEEEQCIHIMQALRKEFDDLLFVFVPRHPERFDSVYQLLRSEGVERYSQWTSGQALDCLLVDAMGELSSLYAIADVALVGGSLVAIGGHNIIEPVIYDVPVVTGPYMHNQKDLLRIFQMHQAMIYATTWQEAALGMKKLLEDHEFRARLTENAQQMLSQYQQALSICMKGVTKALIKKAPN